MARQHIEIWTCDNGECDARATRGDSEVVLVPFAVDGVAHLIYLCQKHAARLRDTLAVYIEKGRMVYRSRLVPVGDPVYRTAKRGWSEAAQAKTERIRIWAWWRANWKAAGLAAPKSEVNRGRLAEPVLEAYEKHNGQPVTSKTTTAKGPRTAVPAALDNPFEVTPPEGGTNGSVKPVKAQKRTAGTKSLKRTAGVL